MRRRGETKEGLSGRVYDEQMMEEAEKAFASHEIRSRGDGRWMLQKRHKDGGWDWTMAAEVVDLAGRLYVGGDIYPVIFGHSSDSPRGKVAWLGGTKDVSYYVHQKASIGIGSSSAMGVVDKYDPAVARWDLNQYINERAENIELTLDQVMVLDTLDSQADFPPGEGEGLGEILEQELPEPLWARLKPNLAKVPRDESEPVLRAFRVELEAEYKEEQLKIDPVVEVIRDAMKWAVDDGHERACAYIYERMGRVDPDFMSERYDFGVVCDPRVYYAWGALRRLHLLLCEEETERGEGEPEARRDGATTQGKY